MFFTILAIIAKVLLTILKILLFLFLFVLLVTGLVLFVPVRYKVAGRYYEDEKTVKLRLSWLLHIVSFRVESDGREVSYILRIFGVKVFPGKSKNKQKRKVKPKSENKTKPRKNSKTNVENEIEEVSNKKYSLKVAETEPDIEISQNKEKTKHDIEISGNKKQIKQDIILDENKKNNGQKNKDNRKKSLWKDFISKLKRLMQFPKKVADLFRKLSYAVKKIFVAVRSGTEKAVLVKEFVFGEECLGFVCVVRDNVLHLWRHIKPKLLKIDMTIGFDDPAVTGQVLGIIAAFCGAAGIMPCVTPDFEKRVFESDIEIKGRVTVFVLLKILIKVYFCEELKEFKKSYKSIREVL